MTWEDQPALFDWDLRLPDGLELPGDWEQIIFDRTPDGTRTLRGIVLNRGGPLANTNYVKVGDA